MRKGAKSLCYSSSIAGTWVHFCTSFKVYSSKKGKHNMHKRIFQTSSLIFGLLGCISAAVSMDDTPPTMKDCDYNSGIHRQAMESWREQKAAAQERPPEARKSAPTPSSDAAKSTPNTASSVSTKK